MIEEQRMNPPTPRQDKPEGVCQENWAKALSLCPAHIAPDAWEMACHAGAEQERMKEALVWRRRDALGRACYLAGADEFSERWEHLPGSRREAYRAIACDSYAVSALSWSPAQQNIVIEYTRNEDLYRAEAPAFPATAIGTMRIDSTPANDAIRRLTKSYA